MIPNIVQTRELNETWTDQLTNGPRFHEIAIQLWRPSIPNGGAVTWTCAPPQFTRSNRTTLVYIYIYTNTCYPLEKKLGWRNERRGSTSPSKHGEFRDAIHSRFVRWLKLFKARHSTGYAYGVSTINFSSRTMIEFFRPRRRRNKFRLDGSETFVDYTPTKDEIGIHGCVAPSRRFRG